MRNSIRKTDPTRVGSPTATEMLDQEPARCEEEYSQWEEFHTDGPLIGRGPSPDAVEEPKQALVQQASASGTKATLKGKQRHIDDDDEVKRLEVAFRGTRQAKQELREAIARLALIPGLRHFEQTKLESEVFPTGSLRKFKMTTTNEVSIFNHAGTHTVVWQGTHRTAFVHGGFKCYGMRMSCFPEIGKDGTGQSDRPMRCLQSNALLCRLQR